MSFTDRQDRDLGHDGRGPQQIRAALRAGPEDGEQQIWDAIVRARSPFGMVDALGITCTPGSPARDGSTSSTTSESTRPLDVHGSDRGDAMSYATPELLAQARDLETAGPDPPGRGHVLPPGQHTVRFATEQTNAGTTLRLAAADHEQKAGHGDRIGARRRPELRRVRLHAREREVAYQARSRSDADGLAERVQMAGAAVVAYRYFGASRARRRNRSLSADHRDLRRREGNALGLPAGCCRAAVPNVQIWRVASVGAERFARKWIPVLIGSEGRTAIPLADQHAVRIAPGRARLSVGAASLLVPGILTNTGHTGGRVGSSRRRARRVRR